MLAMAAIECVLRICGCVTVGRCVFDSRAGDRFVLARRVPVDAPVGRLRLQGTRCLVSACRLPRSYMVFRCIISFAVVTSLVDCQVVVAGLFLGMSFFPCWGQRTPVGDGMLMLTPRITVQGRGYVCEYLRLSDAGLSMQSELLLVKASRVQTGGGVFMLRCLHRSPHRPAA